MLCAAAGGYLIQHVENHGGYHDVQCADGSVVETNSCHHQMQYPFDVEHELLMWIEQKRSSVHYVGSGRSITNALPCEPEEARRERIEALHAQVALMQGEAKGLTAFLAGPWGAAILAAGSIIDRSGGQADIGFFAIDPARAATTAYTAPYVLIEGSYLVRQESPLQDNSEVDRPGTRVTVGQGSAYDLFLTRELKQAEIVRAPSSPTVVDVFVEQQLDVAAGVKQQLEADQQRFPGLRLLPGRFMVIQQAMGLPKGRGEAAAGFLRVFVEEMKASGFVAQALVRHGIQGASVAPASAQVTGT